MLLVYTNLDKRDNGFYDDLKLKEAVPAKKRKTKPLIFQSKGKHYLLLHHFILFWNHDYEANCIFSRTKLF